MRFPITTVICHFTESKVQVKPHPPPLPPDHQCSALSLSTPSSLARGREHSCTPQGVGLLGEIRWASPGLRKLSAQFHRRMQTQNPRISQFEVSSAAEVLWVNILGTLCSVPASAFFSLISGLLTNLSSWFSHFVSGDNKNACLKGFLGD